MKIPRTRIVASPNLECWAALAAEVIGEAVADSISSRGMCDLMLAGGETAGRLYAHWARMTDPPLRRIRILFGDDRCVPPDHADSNYAQVMRTLLVRGAPSGCSIERMRAEDPDREAAARAYESLLPERIDVLLLGLGTDGHVASLFPGSPTLLQGDRSVVPVTGPKPPIERLTITPKVITGARRVFLLATGAEKGRILARALEAHVDILTLPVQATLGRTWVLDAEAECQIRKDGTFLKESVH